ncbi:DnaJ domain-containing protein [Sphingobium phenoxybenzoativorans]|uniref:DnaJ domain-containing protein n=1 Tax=Sphingobium phenoxybenzoativorans TaxID=1592790 RepID=UPI0008720204|nr:DnaJ domain-containing protein [Sphingobium phenoxybenzoativorans]
MAIFAMLLMGLAGWLIWTGRLQRMSGKDGMALGLAIVGAVLAAKGKPVIGALPLILSAGYFALRIRRKRQPLSRAPKSGTKPVPPAPNDAVAEASALLGLPRDADADAIRAAHRRLIASVHPDRGGTEALAAKINAARDTLLQHHENAKGSR